MVVTAASSAMSPKLVSTRWLNSLPERYELKVVPAPKISSSHEVVDADPLVELRLVPAAAAVTSRGLVLSAPLYSSTRTSGYSTAVLKVTDNVLLPAAMFLA